MLVRGVLSFVKPNVVGLFETKGGETVTVRLVDFKGGIADVSSGPNSHRSPLKPEEHVHTK